MQLSNRSLLLRDDIVWQKRCLLGMLLIIYVTQFLMVYCFKVVQNLRKGDRVAVIQYSYIQTMFVSCAGYFTVFIS